MSERLTPEMLHICTSVAERGEFLDVLGITDTYRPTEVPTSVSPMAIIFRFRLPTLKHVVGRLRLVMVDPDGSEIWQTSGQIDLFTEPTPENFPTAVSNMVARSNGFIFKSRGMYELRAYWDNSEVASTPIYILEPLKPGEKVGHGEVIGQ